MALTPVEVRHIQLKRGLFGYRKAAVHRMMDDIADSFETVWRERSQLVERVEELETEVTRHVELEGLLRSTLVSAERAVPGPEGGGSPRGRRDRDRGERRGSQGAARRDHREGAADGRRAPRAGAAPLRARGRRRDARGCRRGRRRRHGTAAASRRTAARLARDAARSTEPPGGVAARRGGAARGSGSSPASPIYPWGMEPRTIRLNLRVSPGAGRSAVVGRHGDAWKLRVSCSPGARARERVGRRPARGAPSTSGGPTCVSSAAPCRATRSSSSSGSPSKRRSGASPRPRKEQP